MKMNKNHSPNSHRKILTFTTLKDLKDFKILNTSLGSYFCSLLEKVTSVIAYHSDLPTVVDILGFK